MKTNPGANKKLASLMPAIGFLLIAVSFVIKQFNLNLIAVAFLAGIGSAWIGIGMVGTLIEKLNPEFAKKQEVNQNDERNIQIREKSGYVAYLVTLFSFAVLEFIFLLTDNNIACILTIAAMANHIASFFLASFYYGKRI